MARRKNLPLKEKIAQTVLEHALPHLKGWIDTLGEMGRPPKKGDPVLDARSRVSAARTGVDFVTKFIGDAGASASGQDLVRALKRLDDTRGSTAAESAEEGDPANDANLGSEADDMGDGQESDS